MPKEDLILTGLRIEPALHQQLVAEAKRADRSLNGEMLHRLRRSLEKTQQPDNSED